MSLFEDPDTLCERTDNRCKQRKKCKRYIENRPEEHSRWVAGYFIEFEQFCPHFIPLEKKQIEIPKERQD